MLVTLCRLNALAQVLDEADRLLQTDQQKTLAEIYKRLPQHGVGDLRLQVTVSRVD